MLRVHVPASATERPGHAALNVVGFQSRDRVKGTKCTRIMDRIRVSLGAIFSIKVSCCGASAGPQGHDESATHFELLNQQRRDAKCGSHDHCVARTAFQPSVITVADLDTHIVIVELSQNLRRAVASCVGI